MDGSALSFVPSLFPVVGQFMPSLEAAGVILEDLRGMGGGRLIGVFGSCLSLTHLLHSLRCSLPEGAIA